MDDIMQRAAATVAAADSVTLTACREGYFPRVLEVAEFRAEDLSTVWMAVRADAASVVTFRQGVRAGVCLRRGKDSVTLTGHLKCVEGADAGVRGVAAGKGLCAVRFTSERASVWIDRRPAHYNLVSHE